MRKILFTSVAAFAIIVSGCSSKSASVSSSSDVNSGRGSGGSDSFENVDAKINRLNNGLEKVYFDFDKFNIRSDMYSVVRNNANIFNNEVSEAQITVEGNCDEWGTDEYNQALGLKRAKAVKDSLISQGVDANRITVKSYGETNPVCTDRTKACDAQNRRAEFVLNK